jgi:DNA-binding transcriptional regulator YiaG
MGGLDEVESYLSGEGEGFHVKAIRQNLHMTQAGFSRTFGVQPRCRQALGGNRRITEITARAYLTVIARHLKPSCRLPLRAHRLLV